jgi:hypothetical protein
MGDNSIIRKDAIATVSGLKFTDLMAADFVLFLRSAILDANGYRAWYPETLLYSARQRGHSKYLHAQNLSPISHA